jgi:hypothetical protein
MLAIFVVGPIFTEIKNLSYYFGDWGTWIYLEHLLLFVRPPTALPGVFEGNIYPRVVNGVFWMVPWLMWCYVLFGVALLFKKHRNMWFCFFTKRLLPYDRFPRIHWEIFLLGFMVQQGLTALYGGKMNHWLNFFLAAAITTPLACVMHMIVAPFSEFIRNKGLLLVERVFK